MGHANGVSQRSIRHLDRSAPARGALCEPGMCAAPNGTPLGRGRAEAPWHTSVSHFGRAVPVPASRGRTQSRGLKPLQAALRGAMGGSGSLATFGWVWWRWLRSSQPSFGSCPGPGLGHQLCNTAAHRLRSWSRGSRWQAQGGGSRCAVPEPRGAEWVLVLCMHPRCVF